MSLAIFGLVICTMVLSLLPMRAHVKYLCYSQLFHSRTLLTTCMSLHFAHNFYPALLVMGSFAMALPLRYHSLTSSFGIWRIRYRKNIFTLWVVGAHPQSRPSQKGQLKSIALKAIYLLPLMIQNQIIQWS